MKLYEVNYINAAGYKREWFVNKAKAKTRFVELKRNENGKESDELQVESLFDIHEHEVEISAKGILKFLNNHCYGDDG